MSRRHVSCLLLAASIYGGALVSSPAMPVPAWAAVPSSVPEPPSAAALRDRLNALVELRERRTMATTPADSPLTPAVRRAVLSLPSLAPLMEGTLVRQLPTGSMRLLSAEDAAGGSKRLRIRAGVERRTDAASPAARIEILVEVLVNADGLPVRTFPIGEDDPEFLALFD